MRLTKTALTAILFLFLINHLPAQELPPIIVNEDIQLIPLAEHMYIHRSWAEVSGFGRVASNGMLYIRKGDALMVDTPIEEEQTKILAEYIRNELHADISLVIPGHFHDDCLAGIPYLHTTGAHSLANKRTKAICKEKGLVLPTHTFNKKKKINFQGSPVELYYFGPGHAPDNIVVWFPSEQLLFGGCMIRSTEYKGLGNTGDAVVEEWGPTVAKVKQAFPEVKQVVPGHGKVGDPTLLDHTIKQAEEYLKKE
jgi:metallo-beta-lactamase class B